MRNASDKLFLLIKSLTKAEKRHFKLFSQLHERKNGNRYVKLFDTIDRQEKYNEEEIKQKLKSKSPMLYFSADKAYLYALLLRTLTLQENHDEFEKLISLYLNARILMKKGLFSDAFEYSKKAETKSLETESFLLAMMAKKQRLRIASKTKAHYSKEVVENFYMEARETIAKETEIIDYLYHHHLMYLKTSFAGASRDEKVLKENKDGALDFFLKENYSFKSTIAENLKSSSLAQYYHYKGDFLKSFQEFQKSMALLDRLKHSNKLDYIINSFNFLAACFKVKNFTAAENMLKEIRNLKLTKTDQKRLEQSLFWTQLHLYIYTNDFDKAIDYTREKEKIILSLWERNTHAELAYGAVYAATALFINKDYSGTIRWLRNFFFAKGSRINNRLDLIGSASLLYMMAHFELRNDEVIYRSVKIIQKQLEDINLLNDFEKKATEFIGRTLTNTKGKLVEKFKLFKKELDEMKKNKEERQYIESLLFTDWLESKISGLSLKQYLTNKGGVS